jgi:hypothetical protein
MLPKDGMRSTLQEACAARVVNYALWAHGTDRGSAASGVGVDSVQQGEGIGGNLNILIGFGFASKQPQVPKIVTGRIAVPSQFLRRNSLPCMTVPRMVVHDDVLENLGRKLRDHPSD